MLSKLVPFLVTALATAVGVVFVAPQLAKAVGK